MVGRIARPEGTPYWHHLVVVAEAVRSQFEAMQQAMRSGLTPEEPTAGLALTGRGFRGQRGRRWEARPGNLHLTAAVPIHAPAARMLPGLTLVPALAAIDALRTVLDHDRRPTIKWVNDILVDGRKIAGVLTATTSTSSTVEGACFGIGINVATAPEITPTPFVSATTCLGDEGAGKDPELLWRTVFALLDGLADALRTLLADGPRALIDRYRAHSAVLGRRVAIFDEESDGASRAELGEPLVEGVVEAVNDDLTLSLRGHPRPVHGGRLAFVGSEEITARR